MDHDVRFALRSDLDKLAAALADGFRDDPMLTWIYPDASRRDDMGRAFMRVALELGFPHGHVYAAGGDNAAAIWSPPDVDMFDDAAVAALFGLLGEQLGER